MIENLSEQVLDQIANRVHERLLYDNMQSNQARIGDLQSRYKELSRQHVLRTGQLVRWKPGLRNRQFPDYGEAGIVVEVLAQPVYDSKEDAGSPYFREPLDILIAVIHEDGQLSIFHFDKRRFEPID